MLRIDDIPNYYPKKESAIRKHKQQFWNKRSTIIKWNQATFKIQYSSIDTTFQLSGSKDRRKKFPRTGIRCYAPYSARHLDWYLNPNKLSDDQKYYSRNARDQLVQKSKVLINVHYRPGDYRIFESIRCYHALECRTLVISEPSVATDKVLLKDYIIFANKGQMAAKLKDVLANYQTYYDQTFSEVKLEEMEKYFESVYRKSVEELMALPNTLEL